MTLRVRIAPFAASLLLATIPLTPASGQAPYARIEGRVHDPMGIPIAEARVVLQGTARWAASDSNGYYAIDFVPPGEATLRAYADGHSAQLARLAVRAGEIRNQDFALNGLDDPSGNLPPPAKQADGPVAGSVATRQTMPGDWVNRLPVDRVEDALFLLPGVLPTRQREVSLRGGTPQGTMRYLDGVPVSPGYQGSRSSGVVSPPVAGIGIGTNALGELTALTGPAPAALGNASAGFVSLLSGTGGPDWTAAGSYEADEPFGLNHGTGFNRLQAEVGGALTTKISLFAAAMLEGHKSAESGFGAESTPLFTVAGLDTTVAVPATPFDPNSDTTFVDVLQYAVSRGECSQFAGSANPGIAGNYGQECRGIRIPRTTSSTYQALGKLEFAPDPRNRLVLLAAGSQDQRRLFDYGSLYNAANLKAQRNWSRLVAIGWSRVWGRAENPLTTDLHLSWQTDRILAGPLTLQSEFDSRDEFGGYLIAPLAFRFDFNTFPVDQELVRNYRENKPGSRRSPYNLENTSQYALVDRWRDGPYALFGFSETGGPTGRISLHREDRVVGNAQAAWRLGRHHTLALGAEFVNYDITHYTHQLTSQAYSDVFIESPIRTGAFLQDHWQAGAFTIAAGFRIDHFSTGASRPFVLDTVSSSSTFGRYHFFPTPGSYGAGGVTFSGQPLVRFVKDGGHTVLSPRLSLGLQADRRTTLRIGYRRLAQAPDFAWSLKGINTDVRITSLNDVWGTDLDYQKSSLYELGVHRELSRSLTLDLAGYHKDLEQQASVGLSALADPQRQGELVDLYLISNRGLGNVWGVDARLDIDAAPWMRGIVGYGFQKATGEGGITAADSRPHSLKGALLIDVPPDWKAGSTLGAVLGNAGLDVVFRYASGTAYTRCPAAAGNEFVMAGEPCQGGFVGDLNGSRLSAYKQLDLKLTRTFSLGARRITAYLDARNLVNFENVSSVFSVTGRTSNPVAEQVSWSRDSSGYAAEASANALYTPGTGSIDLTFGGAAAGGCTNWLNAQNQPATPNCVSLIRAEERFGNGDHVFSLAEQRAASRSRYQVDYGRPTFLGPPRRLRLGIEIGF